MLFLSMCRENQHLVGCKSDNDFATNQIFCTWNPLFLNDSHCMIFTYLEL